MEAPMPVRQVGGLKVQNARPKGLIRRKSKLQTQVEVLRCKLGKPTANLESDRTFGPSKEWTPMYYAVYHQREAALTYFLQNGVSPNDVDGIGQPPLCIAVANGNIEIVKTLLDAGANINATMKNGGETALHIAIKNSKTELIDRLLESRPELEAHTYETNETPLHYAASKSGSLATVVTLLKLGAKCDTPNTKGQSPAEAALLANNIHGAVAIINAAHGKRDTFVKEKEMLLKHVERSQTRFSIGNELIADIFAAACDPDSTVLVEAIKKDDAGLVEMFLDQGADPNRATAKGTYPIFVALECAGALVVQALVKHNADVTARDAKGRTVLQAAFEGSIAQDEKSISAVVDCLLSKHADAKVTYPDGQTLLHRAVSPSFGYARVAHLLLSFGAKVNSPDNYGNTALHLATHSRSCMDVLLKNAAKNLPVEGLPVFETLLLQKGVQKTSWNCVSHEDHNQHDALYYSATMRKFEFVEALLKSGATFTFKDWIPRKEDLHIFEETDKQIMKLFAQYEWSRRTGALRRQSACPESEGQESLFSKMFPTKDLKNMIAMGLDPNALPKTSLGLSLLWAILRQIPLQPPLSPKYLFATVKLILEHGSDPNIGTARGGRRTPSPQASSQDLPLTLHTMTFLLEEYPTVDIDLIILLLTKGTKLSLASPFYNGRYPLHSATNSNRIDLVDEFLLQRSEVNCVDFEGRTPLLIAAEKGFWEIADALLRRGAKIDAKDVEGNMALHAAAIGGSKRIVATLLRAGAKGNIKNKKGQTPLACVPETLDVKERDKIVRMLKDSEEKEKRDEERHYKLAEYNTNHQSKLKQRQEDEGKATMEREQKEKERQKLEQETKEKYPKKAEKILQVSSPLLQKPASKLSLFRTSSLLSPRPRISSPPLSSMPAKLEVNTCVATPPPTINSKISSSPIPNAPATAKTISPSTTDFLKPTTTVHKRVPSPRIDSGFGQKRACDVDKPLPVLDHNKVTLKAKEGDKRNSNATELADWLALSKMMDKL
ncbi:ankyrin repeat-containing domain protein [Phaeosphaeriaceae sp. PMI808]|nr:ankyrin repeat-containing domain protein [Phaeosphaeriaceae sp. PMI808]